MKKMGDYDWEYGVVLRFYEMEQHIKLEDLYQIFKERFLREQAEEREQAAMLLACTRVLTNPEDPA